jgi:hypothetical protein
LKGNYYYLAYFQETRLYRHNPEDENLQDNLKVGFGQFLLVCNNYSEMQVMMAKLQE